MAAQDRIRWDQIYRERADRPYPEPHPLLFEFTPPAEPERGLRALDLAGGLGQNALWLSTQGYEVDLMDISRTALLRAQEEMRRRGLRRVNLLQVDLDQPHLDADAYALVCVFRFLKRELFPLLRASIQPGGRIIYETFNRRYLQILPAFNPQHLLEVGELVGYFADWKLLLYQENDHIAQLVAIKPPAGE